MQDLSQFEEITDLDFSAEGSHLAVCHKMQGGSANGVHHMLLAKSDKDLDDVQILSSVRVLKSLEQDITDDLLEKAAMSYTNIKNMLHDVLVDTYGDCVWIADFTDKVVVFMDEGVYYAQPYRHRRGEYHLIEDRANVILCEYFSLDPNNIVSDETKKLLEAGSEIVITKSEQGNLAEVFESLFDIEQDLSDIAEDVNKAKAKTKVNKEDLEDEEHDEEEEEDRDDDLDVDVDDDNDDDEEDELDDIDLAKVKKYISSHKVYKRDEVTKEGEPKKTFDGVKRPAKDFAYVPDKNKPSTWKLPIFDKEYARLAEQALTSGLMGNKVKIPSEDLAGVKRKVSAANKKFKTISKSSSDIGAEENQNPDKGVTTVEVQDITKSAEFIELQKSMLALQEQNNILKAKEDARVKTTFTNVVKSAGFLDEDASPAIVEFLCKASDESAELLVGILEKAKTKIEEVEAKVAEIEAEKDVIKATFGKEQGFGGEIRSEAEIEKAGSCMASFKELLAEKYNK